MWESAINNIDARTNEVWHLFVDWVAIHGLQIVIIIVGAEIFYRLAIKALSQIVHRAAHRPDLFPTEIDRKKRVQTLDSLVNTGVRIIVLIVASIMIVSELGINTAPLIASAGVIGVALGFGAQSLIKDFMSGFFVITENQFRVGDVVEISTSVGSVKISGVVEAITIRTTIIRDLDGKLHHIPNGNIIVATNMTMNYAAINEQVVVEQTTDIDKLEHLINHVGEEVAASPDFHKMVIEPPRFVRVDKIDKDGLVVKIFGKTTPGDQWQVKGEFYKKLIPILKKNSIVLSHQQIVVHQASKN